MRDAFRRRWPLLLAAAFTLMWTNGPVARAATWYVDADAAAGGDGTSWSTAFRYLQDALENGALAAGDSIWVAEGTYYPDDGLDSPPGDPRDATFQLENGVGTYGGFAGDESALAERDPEEHPTVLSGDIDGSSGLAGNSCHVVSASGVDEGTTLSGFTITGGNANGSTAARQQGGGLRLVDSALQMSRCKFIGSQAVSYGAGLYISGDDGTDPPYVVSSQFLDHSEAAGTPPLRGAGASCLSTTARFHGCLFHDNSTDGTGGGIFSHNSALEIVNCTVTNNFAQVDGGGIQLAGSGVDTIRNSIFWDNGSGDETHEEAQIYRYGCVEGLPGGGPGCATAPVVQYNDILGCCSSGCDPFHGFCINAADQNSVEGPAFCDQSGGNLRLTDGSPCKEEGRDGFVPADTADVDDDGNVTEQLPWDLDERARLFQAVPSGARVDVGAYEDQNLTACPEDLNGDGTVDDDDRDILLAAWGFNPGHPADLVCANNTVDEADEAQLLGAYGACP